ncbi:MAG TPA: mannosyltransferase family protein [Ktedonobacteraceae bacterium]|nr:mannosyltransferase family protein [Ktedonobacteraceae bacterium]
MKHAPVREILWIFVLTRLLLVLITYFGYIILIMPNYSSTPVDLVAICTSWNHWDAANYVRIAQFGYQTYYDVAFFPLFPLLIRIIAFPFGPMAYLPVGIIISNAALLGAMFVIYQLAVEIGGEEVARRTLLYLCIFPTAFFFFPAYNESLFILLTSGAFLAMRRERWWLAGLLGFLAAMTRSVGILLVFPYLFEIWQNYREEIIRWRTSLGKLLLTILPIVLIPAGLGLYALYCWQIRGDPLAFAAVQSHWARQATWPWQGIWQALFEVFWSQPLGSSNEAQILIDLSATLGFIALTILGWKKHRKSYILWSAVLLLTDILSSTLGQPDPLISNRRFVLELFPAFITLAMLGIKRPRLHQTIVTIFPALYGLFGFLFLLNRWMV